MAQEDTRVGLVYSIAANVIWGLMPLYWRLLTQVSALEVTVHRVLWCGLAMGIIALAGRRLARIAGSLRDLRLLATLLATGLLIIVNWGVYIWAVETENLIETSLGYYINPLLYIALGVVLLGERLSALRGVAVALALAAVAVQVLALGEVPFVALVLAFTFAFYGYLRKTACIGALDGVFVETGLLFPVTLGLVLYWGAAGEGALFAGDSYTDFLLIFSGPMTAFPLVLFSAGARQARLSTVGFVQYLSPSITLTLATFLFGEPFTAIDAFTFGCVWLALALLAFESRLMPPRANRREAGSLPPALRPPGTTS